MHLFSVSLESCSAKAVSGEYYSPVRMVVPKKRSPRNDGAFSSLLSVKNQNKNSVGAVKNSLKKSGALEKVSSGLIFYVKL